MDWTLTWSAVTAGAAVVAALGAVGALLATALQLQQVRLDRESDYYRRLTPFLSLACVPTGASTSPLVDVYADGGGPAFNVEIILHESGNRTYQWPSKVISYLREGPPERIHFQGNPTVGKDFTGRLSLSFKDQFGLDHRASQAVRWEESDWLKTSLTPGHQYPGQITTTGPINWSCEVNCRVHVTPREPKPGYITRVARWLRLY